MDVLAQMVGAVRARLAGWSTAIDLAELANDKAPTPSSAAAFIRPVLRSAGSHRTTLGPNARREPRGVLIVQVFVPLGSGYKAAGEYAEALCDLFRDFKHDSGGFRMQFMEPDVQPVGRSNGMHQINVSIEYRASFYSA